MMGHWSAPAAAGMGHCGTFCDMADSPDQTCCQRAHSRIGENPHYNIICTDTERVNRVRNCSVSERPILLGEIESFSGAAGSNLLRLGIFKYWSIQIPP